MHHSNYQRCDIAMVVVIINHKHFAVVHLFEFSEPWVEFVRTQNNNFLSAEVMEFVVLIVKIQQRMSYIDLIFV